MRTLKSPDLTAAAGAPTRQPVEPIREPQVIVELQRLEKAIQEQQAAISILDERLSKTVALGASTTALEQSGNTPSDHTPTVFIAAQLMEMSAMVRLATRAILDLTGRLEV